MKKQEGNKLRGSAGFTLVELIVVIAIIGILAGVGTVGYGGYIKKANEAADQQLLAVVNTAFGAAVLENNDNPRNVNATAAVSETGVTVNPYNTEFQKYYAGNGGFKVYKSLVYDKANGVFTGSKISVTSDGSGNYTVTLANGKTVTYTATDAQKRAVADSTFGTNMTMGELMGDVSGVVGAAQAVLGPGAANTIKGIIGDDYLKELGLVDDKGNLKDGVGAQQLSNALVLAVAKNTGTSTANAINSAISNNNIYALIDYQNMNNTLPNVAALYGMMTGYANSDTGKSTMIKVDGKSMSVYDYFKQANTDLANSTSGSAGLNNVMAMMQNISSNQEGLNAYMFSGQAGKDLTGYIQAMSTITANTNTLVNDNGVLNTGFSDTDLVAILNGIFASNP